MMYTMTGTTPKENSLRLFIKRNPLLAMYIIMFTIAWSIMIPRAMYSQGIVPTPLPGFLEILTGWSSAIAAIVVSAVVAGREGVRALLGRLLIWKVGARWYLVGAFLLALIILGGIGLHVLFGGAMPMIPAAGTPVWQVALIFLLFVLLGFLINTEEIAWRGFALPHLQAGYGALLASLFIAVPEVLLHLPLFWVQDSFYRNVGLGGFTAFSVAAVFVYTYVFNRTKGSLLIVTLLHASQNAWSSLLSDNSPRPFYFTVALFWVLALVLIVTTKGRLGYSSDESERNN